MARSRSRAKLGSFYFIIELIRDEVHELFQVSIPDELVKESLQSSETLSSISAIKLIMQITSLIMLGVKNLAEICTKGSLARRYSSLTRHNGFTITLAVQADAEFMLPSILTHPRWWGLVIESYLQMVLPLSLGLTSSTCGQPKSMPFRPTNLQALDGYVPAVSSFREQLTWILPRGVPGYPMGII
ncbi:hypothetical protein Acr_25g0002820 [Actinidia rufa]|uniref:Uncharacterized protein n=1 Tax=Actinidia rufa TaxID=165716 RepID=A0A7J0GYH3_9ERIC|nr:hypothetical protein Acr_25g0002820 [Actinidia rufa]